MKKGYYINCMKYKDLEDIKYSGVYLKVSGHVKELNKYTKCIHELYNTYGEKNSIIKKIFRRLPYTPISKKYIYNEKFEYIDYIYFRKDVIDYSVYSFFKKIKKHNKNIKIILDIPTYPYDGELSKRIIDKPFLYKDHLNRNRLYKYVDKIVTPAIGYKEIFKIETINIINGIDPSLYKISKYISNVDSTINIIAVSTLAEWHGYDRLIRGLAMYYSKEKIEMNVVFHLVGEGVEMKKYQNIVKNYQLYNYVKFYGFKRGSELEDIYNKCDIAIGSLGLHRIGIKVASSLKTREYAARGLPIIASSKIDFIPEQFKYVYYVPSDESNINIIDIIEFYNKIYKEKDHSIVYNEMRAMVLDKCDISKLFTDVINYINS